MHQLLAKLLSKRNLKKEDLSAEEKGQFQQWQVVLTGEQVTVEKLAEFCHGQLEQIKSQMADLNNSDSKNTRLVLLLSVYTALLGAINAPAKERANLESYLNSLLKE